MSNASPTGGLLPHHLSEFTYRFYEPYLTLAVTRFPEEVSWDVAEIRRMNPDVKVGPVTFTARFRDAYVSLLRFNWTTTVDRVKLETMRGKFAIALQPGTSVVWFKNRQHKSRPSHLMAEARGRSPEGAPIGPVLWKDATTEEIEALCLLLNNKRLHGPFLVDGKVRVELREQLQSTLDVALTWDETRKQTVIT